MEQRNLERNRQEFSQEDLKELQNLQEMADEEGFVPFREVAWTFMEGMQAQYASRYIDGAIPGWPNLGEGLRFKGEASNYYSVKIHKDDIEEFVKRVRDYQRLRLEKD